MSSVAYRNRRKMPYQMTPGKYGPFIETEDKAVLILKGHCSTCFLPPGQHFMGCKSPTRNFQTTTVHKGPDSIEGKPLAEGQRCSVHQIVRWITSYI